MDANGRTTPASGIEAVVAMIDARVPDPRRDALMRFAREYYRQVAPEDLAERSAADLYGAALSHWNFARRREPGTASVRVYNPAPEAHGFGSTHTIVEIVTDDMPFLVDSVTMEVNRHGLTLHLFVHPILRVVRDAGGALQDVLGPTEPDDAGLAESFMHVEVDRIVEPDALAALRDDVARVLGDVRAATEDWSAMKSRLAVVVGELRRRPPPIDADALDETIGFLEWLSADHYIFLGYRCNDLIEVDGSDALRAVPGSGLGLLRDTSARAMSTSFAALPPSARALAREPEPLVLTKSSSRSTVHRPGYMDYVGVKRFDASGRVIGEHRLIGLYTSRAYSTDPASIPMIRRKVARVIDAAGVVPGSHAAKALQNILETYPRDELFQIDDDSLAATATGILHLGERQRFRLFVRRDPYERMVSCLIYAPRENYTTALRLAWQRLLIDAFNGTSADFGVFLSESVLARVLITVRTTPGRIPAVDVVALEARLAAASRRWEDDLSAALVAELGEARGAALYRRFGHAFPAAYRDEVTPRRAVPDVALLARVVDGEPLGLMLYRAPEAPASTLRFKLLRRGAPVPLSDSLPMLERMGLRVIDEHPYEIAVAGGSPVFIHDFGLVVEDDEIDLDAARPLFEDAFAKVFAGRVENDGFNRLVLAAGLDASEVAVLRAYAHYLRQIGFPLSPSFVEGALAAHPLIARMIVHLFRLRFDPEASPGDGDDPAAHQLAAIEQALAKVGSLNEDRVLRQYVALVRATLRTNFWCTASHRAERDVLAFKLDPSRIPGMPAPAPMFEIFVDSPRFEGVHLRGGKVARGGLRWSDRPEDFRTEVLGLMKAQMVKNTVIVPVGSKGGFVLKKAPPPGDRDATMREGIACYQDYLRALLDLTDNLVDGAIAPPARVRRHDGDDPYLVVAADKGTATFSDHANAISAEYRFWLGDAFASGGSAGYDHKAMGITARGAWESVKRHFREMGIDTQSTDFTVVGIGDMSGDVFGNGMLLSRHIRLVAAFDHRHVFLDPDPDAAAGYAERERLFALPRSSWADYDVGRISDGGGVWPRSAKSIPLSPQVRARLAVDAAQLAPNELIAAILKAPVDLLYNGGIGTYVKGSAQTHAEAGDRANDAVRIDGRQLRCKVVAEGGNLGFTQPGRIEYALAGGRIYTDAIDNSAGVDTSDHEVNLKILLGMPIAEGELTVKQRNALLAQMTDEVAALVLRDNYHQTQALSLARRRATEILEPQARLVRFLEKAGRLDRALEHLPDDETIARRRAAGHGLTAPEGAVLLAYAKMWLTDELVGSPLPDDRWVATALARYFPAPMRERFAAWLPRHPLRREIIATHVANSMVNRVGATFVHRIAESTGATPAEIVRGYLLAREVFGFVPLWQAIEALDAKVTDAVQAEMLVEAGRTVVRATTWFLRSAHLPAEMAATIATFRDGVDAVRALLRQRPRDGGGAQAAAAAHVAAGVPAELASTVATFDLAFGALDITEIATATGRPLPVIADVYFELASRLGLEWLRKGIGRLPADTHWQALSRTAMRDELSALARSVAMRAVADGGRDDDAASLLRAWEARTASARERTERMLAELRTMPALDAPMAVVAMRELRNLA